VEEGGGIGLGSGQEGLGMLRADPTQGVEAGGEGDRERHNGNGDHGKCTYSTDGEPEREDRHVVAAESERKSYTRLHIHGGL
jgi:hypothetical protein